MPITIEKVELISKDNRGEIFGIVRQNEAIIKSVLRITMLPGSIRGNHLHKSDVHWVFVESGKMKYSEADPTSPNKVESVILESGEMIKSVAGRIHAMQVEGKEEVVFWAISTEPRDQSSYEGDTKRIKIV